MQQFQKGIDFERLIERVHKILEPNNSDVRWNEKIPDPDNPEQGRQIDIIIRHPDYIEYVECRIHKKAQNVKWIESLIGLKCSLNIDRIIAVSANGFTKGAIKKAERFNIELRRLEELTREEVLSWKSKSTCYLLFYRVNMLTTQYSVDITSNTFVTDDEIIHNIKSSNLSNHALDYYFHKLLSMGLKENISLKKEFLLPVNVKIDDIVRVSEILVSGSITTFQKKLDLSIVSKFKTESFKDKFKDLVTIENFERMIEVIQSNHKSSTRFNFAEMTLPDNVVFSGDMIIGSGEMKTLGEFSFDNLKSSPRLPVLKIKIIRN
jgi:hypothetical protein